MKMKVPKIFSTIAAAAILFASSANVSAAPNYVEGVDWKNQVITVTGTGIVPTNAVNIAQAKGLASHLLYI